MHSSSLTLVHLTYTVWFDRQWGEIGTFRKLKVFTISCTAWLILDSSVLSQTMQEDSGNKSVLMFNALPEEEKKALL